MYVIIMYCNQCGASVDKGGKFCSNCGSSVELSKGAKQVNIQDSVIQKKSDNRVFNTDNRAFEIGTNINTDEVNVYVSETNEAVDIKQSLKNGILMFKSNNFDASNELFAAVLKVDAFNSLANLYLGLSLMNGKNALTIPHKTVKKIESYLMMALDSDETRNGALLGLAAIKYDFYLSSGFIEKSPKYSEVKSELINKNNISARDVEIINYINASKDLREDLFEKLE